MTDNRQSILLILANDGIGMPQINFDTEVESLELRLIRGLSEDIDAEVRFEVNDGTKISIKFKYDQWKDPESMPNKTTTIGVHL
jgi:two-component sensor histidine kinase